MRFRAAGLDMPAEFSREGAGYLVDVGTELLAQQLAESGVVIEPPQDSADRALPFEAV